MVQGAASNVLAGYTVQATVGGWMSDFANSARTYPAQVALFPAFGGSLLRQVRVRAAARSLPAPESGRNARTSLPAGGA